MLCVFVMMNRPRCERNFLNIYVIENGDIFNESESNCIPVSMRYLLTDCVNFSMNSYLIDNYVIKTRHN